MRKALIDEILLRCEAALAQRNDSFYGFTPQLVRHSNDRYFLDRGMLLDHFFDLARVNVGSAADDHVFLAVEDEQISTGVHVADITGVNPSIPDYIGGCLRLPPRATDQRIAT